jgi:hypothetical protein
MTNHLKESTRQATPWGAKTSRWILAAAVAGAALAVGTVHTGTLCVVTLVLVAATVLGWWDAEPLNARPAATLLLGTGVVLTTYTALQCVPMPIGWLAAIAPHNADVWSRALLPLHEAGPRWAPISVDPPGTRVEVLKGVAYLLAFVTALRVARRREGVAFLSAVIVATGLVLAAAALLHPALGARKLYGIYEPSIDYNRHLAPFLDANNLAGYLNVALCLALAAALAPEPRLPRPILWAAALVLAATQVWVASRGGVVAMVIGVVLLLVIMRMARMKQRRKVAATSLVVGVVIAAGAFMIVLGSSKAGPELFDPDLSKLDFFRQAMHMVPAYPIFGTGRGAFGSAYPAFRHGIEHMTYTYPENVIAQWVTEWGVPVGVLGLIAMSVGLRPNAVLARSSTAAGAWAAIVAIAVHNLVDLGSEIPGLALAPVVCGAIVVGGTSGRAARWRVEEWGSAGRTVAIAGATAAACAVAGAAIGIGHEVLEDRQAMYEAVIEQHVSVKPIHALARATMLRHPAEPYFPFIAGLRAAQAHDDAAMPWIEATLERARVYGPAHLVLARIVAKRSPSQARLEYRLAMEQAPELTGPVMAEAPRVVGSYDDATELVPAGPRGAGVIDQLEAAVQARLPATCVRLDAEVAARAPTEPGPALRAARDAVQDLEAGESAPWCEEAARANCAQRALRWASRAGELLPERCEPRALHARARMADGDVAGALRELGDAADLVGERVPCLQALVAMAGAAHDERRVTWAVEGIANAGCLDTECAQNLAWAASTEETRGNRQRALALYKRAYVHTPDNDTLLESVARVAAAEGLHAEAADSYERLAREHPGEARWARAADDQRNAAVKAVMKF